MLRIIIISLIFNSSIIYGQNYEHQLVNKKGTPVFPETGDISIGINANPFLEFAGNIFTNAQNNAPQLGFTAQHPGTIYGKYMISDTKAIRGGLTIGISFNSDKVEVDNNSFSTYKESAISLGFSLGIENIRYSKTRIKGFYGYEGGVSIIPYSNWSENAQRFVTGRLSFLNPSDRNQEFSESGGNTFQIQFKGFAGMEVFLFPKISLGGEIGISAIASAQDKRKFKPNSGSEVTILPGSGSFSIAPYISGDLVLNIYF